MCGIVGYVGQRDALEILLDGLERLEYRGYDSAGVALSKSGEIGVRKARGRLSALRALLRDAPVSGTVGIGHTRWATHGEPTDENAHPHTDNSGEFAVVHNGIIENHAELRAWLEGQGYRFQSETDTEVVAHLLAHFWRGDFLNAAREAVTRLQGSFALCLLCRDDPEKIICAKKDSPLIIGLSDGEQYIASDIPALLPHTRRILILEDREMAIVTRQGCEILGAYGQPVAREPQTVAWDQKSADLNGFAHYMIKEIHDQPAAMRAVLDAYTEAENGVIRFKPAAMPFPPEAARAFRRLTLIGCGSAYHAAAVGKAAIERAARVPVEIDIASEFRYRNPIFQKDDLFVCVSQSGETADTLAALRLAKKHARTLAVVNALNSSIAREAHDAMYTLAGPEIAVATTKGYTTQVLCLILLALYLAEARGEMGEGDVSEALKAISQAPAKIEQIIENPQEIQRFASAHYDHRSVFFIGRGIDHAIAMESSLKLKEITYTHSEAYAAGELKHGTIALIEPGSLVVALVTQKELAAKSLLSVQEVKSRGAKVLAVTTNPLKGDAAGVADEVWSLPCEHPLCMPLVAIVPMQLLAYSVALARGCDIDKPRNLAKSVTVE